MSKEKDLLATDKESRIYIITSMVRATSFKEAINIAPYGKVINIGLSNEEDLEDYD